MESALVLVVVYGVGTNLRRLVGAGWLGGLNLICRSSTSSRSKRPASVQPTPILNRTFLRGAREDQRLLQTDFPPGDMDNEAGMRSKGCLSNRTR